MKKPQLRERSTKDLVTLFAEIGRAQDKALLGNQIAKFNRLFDQMADVSFELKSRPGDQRRELVTLYDFPNIQVRLKAAIHTLAVCPREARRQLEDIAGMHWFPQTADASGMLDAIDRGQYVPM